MTYPIALRRGVHQKETLYRTRELAETSRCQTCEVGEDKISERYGEQQTQIDTTQSLKDKYQE